MSNKLTLMVNFLGGDKLSGAIRNIIGTGKTGAQVLKGMAREASGLERELAKVRREIETKTRGNIIKLIDQERALASQLEKTNAELKRRKRLMEIDANADRIRARGDQIMDRGRDNIVQGTALGAPLVLAAKAAGDFSSGMVDIRLKENLTAKATEKLRNEIILAAQAAGQMPEDMRSAVDILAGFGLKSSDAAQMIPAIGRLGTAFKVELADGADAAYANLNNLKVPLAQTGRAFDIMATAGNAGAFEIRDMARHFPGLTSRMRALGDGGLQAVGNLSAALQIARRGTGTADEAANNVKNLLQKINSPATVQAFKKNFGMDLPAEMKKLKAQGIDTFEAIALLTKKATKGDLSKLGYAFEDSEAQGAIRSLVLDMEDYRKIRDDSMKASGTVDAAFKVRTVSDFNAKLNATKGQLSTLILTLGNGLLPAISATLGHFNVAATAVTEWGNRHPQAAALIIQLIAGLAAFKIGLGAVQFALGGLFGPLATIYKFWSKLFPAGLMASRAFGIVAKGGILFGRTLLFVGRAMLMNPIGLLVTAIGVAAYLIYSHWDKIKGAFSAGIAYLGQAWGWLKSNARNILEFSGPIGRAALFIWDNWATIKQAFSQGLAFVSGLVGRFVSVGRAIIDGLVAGITAAPGKIWSALKGIIGGAWQKSKEFLGIASPSRLFATMGGHISAGLAMGIDRGGRQPLGSMKRLAAGVAAAGAMSLSPSYAAAPRGGAGAASGPAMQALAGAITINVYGAEGQDVKALADEVIRRLESAQAVRRRSAFDDE